MSVFIVYIKQTCIRDIAVDNLSQCDVPAISREIEALRLHARRIHGFPFHSIFRKLCIRSRLSLRCYRSNCRRSVYRLLGASDVGQPERVWSGIWETDIGRGYVLLFRPVHHLVRVK
jgi:hypothetical protein